MRTRRRYKRREERARHSSCCPESTMPVLPRRGCQAGAQHAAPLHGWEQRGELACGEVFQGAEASVEFGGRQAPQAVESAQKIPGRTVALARVAFETAGNQVAVGIASQAHAWHNVVEALHGGSDERRNRGTDGTFSDVHVISIVWLVMIGDFQSRGTSVCPRAHPAPWKRCRK